MNAPACRRCHKLLHNCRCKESLADERRREREKPDPEYEAIAEAQRRIYFRKKD